MAVKDKEILLDAKFGKVLKRSNKQLRDDRAAQIVAQTEKSYRRKVEDLQDRLDQLKYDREAMMDVNPSNTQTIINPSDFDHDGFVGKDLDYGKKIRETQILLDIATEQYEELFGAKKEE